MIIYTLNIFMQAYFKTKMKCKETAKGWRDEIKIELNKNNHVQ